MKKLKLIFGIFIFVFLISSCSQAEIENKEQTSTKKSVSPIAQHKTKEDAEKVAQKFAIDWQNSNYDEIYNGFTPKLQSLRSKNDFINFIKKGGRPFGEKGYIIYDKVVLQNEEEAYAYYTFSGILERKLPPLHLIYTNGRWKFDTFESLFTGDCPINCNDFNRCTDDICSAKTNFECVYKKIACNCTSKVECPSDRPNCLDGNCSEKECDNDLDCPNDKPFCDLNNHCSIIKKCQINSDCRYNLPSCYNGYCAQCSKDLDCPKSMPFCTEGSCSKIKKCATDSDCRFDLSYCRYGYCSKHTSYPLANEYDLSAYPSYFIKDGKFNGILIVGDKSPGEDVIGISDIISSLQFVSDQRIQVGAAKLAMEVNDINTKNTIIVGNPCVNTFIAKLMGSNSIECLGGLEKGKGIITLYKTSDKTYALAINGYDPEDRRKAAEVLANYKDYDLSGTRIEVTGTLSKPIINKIE